MWLRPQGYACIVSPDDGQANLDGFQRERVARGQSEFDTMSCGHCNRIVHVKARARPEDIGGLCKQCMRPICPHCVDIGSCTPFLKQLEMAEERDRIRKSYEI